MNNNIWKLIIAAAAIVIIAAALYFSGAFKGGGVMDGESWRDSDHGNGPVNVYTPPVSDEFRRETVSEF